MTTCFGNDCSPRNAGDVFDSVLFVVSFFPGDVLEENRIESVPETFLSILILLSTDMAAMFVM